MATPRLPARDRPAGARRKPAGTLYVVATPIGNLADLSRRARTRPWPPPTTSWPRTRAAPERFCPTSGSPRGRCRSTPTTRLPASRWRAAGWPRATKSRWCRMRVRRSSPIPGSAWRGRRSRTATTSCPSRVRRRSSPVWWLRACLPFRSRSWGFRPAGAARRARVTGANRRGHRDDRAVRVRAAPGRSAGRTGRLPEGERRRGAASRSAAR